VWLTSEQVRGRTCPRSGGWRGARTSWVSIAHPGCLTWRGRPPPDRGAARTPPSPRHAAGRGASASDTRPGGRRSCRAARCSCLHSRETDIRLLKIGSDLRKSIEERLLLEGALKILGDREGDVEIRRVPFTCVAAAASPVSLEPFGPQFQHRLRRLAHPC
jgi:hypothetical protein